MRESIVASSKNRTMRNHGRLLILSERCERR